jgi:predicted esterase
VTTYSLDAAVRRDVVTSVNQASAEMTMGRMDESGLDLVEVSAHAGSRPEREPVQGKVYSVHGRTEGYPLLSETGYGTAGGICGVNCKHTIQVFHAGLSKQTDTSYLPSAAENKQIYEDTQRQRTLERRIRDYKRQAAACEAIGDSEGAAHATSLVRNNQAAMRQHIASTGLRRQYPREQI